MQYLEAGGMFFPVIGQVEISSGDAAPMIEINMMSDERWEQLTEESAVNHFRKWYGREPESLQEAFEGQRAYIERFLHETETRRRCNA